MITVETIELNGIQYKRTYSDTYTITRDGVEYTEAIDPYDSDRVYEETENQLNVIEADVEEIQAAIDNQYIVNEEIVTDVPSEENVTENSEISE